MGRPTTPVRGQTQPVVHFAGPRSAGPPGVKLRKMHDVEVMLAEREERLNSAESRLTQQHLEIQRLRGSLDSRDKDIQYVHRLLERARADSARMATEVCRMEAELDAHRETGEASSGDGTRTPPRSRLATPRGSLSSSSSVGALSARGAAAAAASSGSSRCGASEERCARLEGRLGQEQEATRAQQREVARLQREVLELKEALAARFVLLSYTETVLYPSAHEQVNSISTSTRARALGAGPREAFGAVCR